MLRLERGRIVWDEEDIIPMAKILGSDMVVKGWTPFNPAVVKLALKKRLLVDKLLQRLYEQADALRRSTRSLKKALDADDVRKYRAKYFGHQRADLLYMAVTGLPAYLIGHDVGVGKTIVGIDWAEQQMSVDRRAKSRALVICPNSAKEQWAEAIETWGTKKLPITIVEGTGAQQVEKAMAKWGWVIGHWESLVHARIGYTTKPWTVAILDEVHLIQNRNAQRTMAVMELMADRRLALTANPFTNSTDEMFPILQFLYPETYNSFWRFVGMHVEVVPKPFGGMDMGGARRPKLLNWEIEPFFMRRTKRQVWKNLPPITRVRRLAHLTKKGRSEYERLRKEFFAEIDGEDDESKVVVIPSQLARITRMRQYLIDPGLVGGSERSVKYPVVLELLDELSNPPVIFTSFRQAALRLASFLRKERRKIRVDLITGGMKKKITPVKKSFLRGDLDALIVVTQAGGTALNLGKYGYVAHLDLPWHPRDLQQTEGRVDRPEEGTGKLVPTTAYRVIVDGSYEERLEKRLEKKYERFENVFSIGSLRELFG